MESPIISIIVPCYNQAHFIEQTLDSVYAQTYQNWECIVVNDGSSDDSESKILPYTKKDARFKYIVTENFGVSNARNTGIKCSKGEFIFPLDGDDYIHPTCIEKCLNEFLKNANLKLVYTDVQKFGESNGIFYLPKFTFKKLLSQNLITNSALFLRNDFNRIGGYRLNMVEGFEDWDFWIALLYDYDDNQVLKINEPLMYYRIQKKSRTDNINQGEKSKMLANIIYNNFVIYNKYFSNIFNRIQSYDYHLTILNKPIIKLITNLLHKLHTIRTFLFSSIKSIKDGSLK